jgi:hypothetical protein
MIALFTNTAGATTLLAEPVTAGPQPRGSLARRSVPTENAMPGHFRMFALCAAAALFATGCSKTDTSPQPNAVAPVASAPGTPAAPVVAAPDMPDPKVPKGAEAPAPMPGQGGDQSSPAFKDGGKADPHK